MTNKMFRWINSLIPIKSEIRTLKDQLKKDIKLLESHNEWRRGSDETVMISPKELGEAIDRIVNHYKSNK